MQETEFRQIANLLKIYPGCCKEEEQVKAWWASLRNYDFRSIYDAVERYIRTETRTPVPASIISLIPKADPSQEFKPKYETIDGEVVKVVQCQRCQDSGLVTWYDEEGMRYGRPCDCPAGHHYYRWGWLTREGKEEYVRKYGHHGEDMTEDWYGLWETERTG